MKAIILLGTLKNKGLSNTEILVEFLGKYLAEQNIDFEVIRLANHTIVPGTYTHMDVKDDWPAIYNKIIEAKIILFATPIWWNSHSSELQRCIERLDEVYDIILEGKDSPLDGKIGGVIVTGDSDGVEHITGNIANFFCSIGVTVPAYTSLGVIWEGHAKNAKKTKAQILKYYKTNYDKDAQAMAESLKKASQ
ncbi:MULTISPECIES: flavodoxin family protein [unclassified Flavobacterium]|uniref:flavodoxin family protein n=1 Tax=unclassified Flavobacterium TaxID=196869 RepID=UPI00105C25D7|nr:MULTISPECIES: flavodoxin family protein [unclassified Flavobacterium]TDP00233.1 multimeric flavodoxin WrbA [Flavobacterium sp. 245]TDW52160.1 multimeric flavodoxin WrbA [Flavobacterium sp. 270]